MMPTHCPECGVDWSEATCEQNFHQMLFWEQADMVHLGVVHHLMVLTYHLQHPGLYSPDALKHSMGLLVDFVARGVTPQQVRQRDRDKVDSGKRTFRIKGTPESHGTYDHPVAWTMTAADVVAGGVEHYVENVRTWAQSVYDDLARSGNLEATHG